MQQLSARRMAVWDMFCKPLLRRHVHRELLRSVWLAVTPIISATACLQRNYIERYNRSTCHHRNYVERYSRSITIDIMHSLAHLLTLLGAHHSGLKQGQDHVRRGE